MKKYLQWLKNEESGQGMVEYGLIIGVVALVVVVGAAAFGTKLTAFFTGLSNNANITTP